jgi:hypothetical protein
MGPQAHDAPIEDREPISEKTPGGDMRQLFKAPLRSVMDARAPVPECVRARFVRGSTPPPSR